jgi:hypothetical protein
MKVLIFDSKEGNEAPYWTKFRLSLDREVWPAAALVAYRATLVRDNHYPYIEFENESDATFFMLKWS